MGSPITQTKSKALQSSNDLAETTALKLGIFSANVSRPRPARRCPNDGTRQWENNVALARMAETGGMDFMLPVARWKGSRGPTNFEGRSLEIPERGASALLALTKTIRVFSPVHVALLHPGLYGEGMSGRPPGPRSAADASA